MTSFEIIAAVIGTSGLGGLLLGIYNAILGARKGSVDEWRGLLQEHRELILQLRKQLEEKEEEIEDLKDWAERLVCQVKGAGLEPVMFKIHTVQRASQKQK